MRLFDKNQHIVYDGKWTTHSVGFLTKLSRQFSVIPWEVIILFARAVYLVMQHAIDAGLLSIDDDTPVELTRFAPTSCIAFEIQLWSAHL